MTIFKHLCIILFVAIIYLSACSASKKNKTIDNLSETKTSKEFGDTTKTDEFLENLLSKSPLLKNVLNYRKDFNVQIIYTQINRNENGEADLKNFYFNVNDKKYFYPASTIKLPIVLLTLQKLNELKDKRIDKYSTMITEATNFPQTPVYNDPTTIDGKPTIANYIKKILMVSDNDAYNRLYEFLGQDYINKELSKKGYKSAQILHRFQIPFTDEENKQTNPIKFFDFSNNLLFSQAAQYNKNTYNKRKDSLGKAYIQSSGKLINKPMDFSLKNKISLEDLNNILISVVLPNKVPSYQQFNITEEDRKFVLKYMSQYPTESVFPPYSSDTSTYYPAYCKYLMLGNEKENMPPKGIRIFNKVGLSYGQLIDVAYIVDYEKKIEFFLSAEIYCNSDGVLNDDKYDYENIGFPFMKNVGNLIYDYELKRNKTFLPNLLNIQFTYDKQ